MDQNAKIFIQEKAFENVICIMLAIFLSLNVSITSAPYGVLPLSATRFAACTGGIWVTFFEPYLT